MRPKLVSRADLPRKQALVKPETVLTPKQGRGVGALAPNRRPWKAKVDRNGTQARLWRQMNVIHVTGALTSVMQKQYVAAATAHFQVLKERVERMHKEDELDLVEEHILPRIPDVLAPMNLPVGDIDIDPGRLNKDFQSFDEGPLRALGKEIGVPQACGYRNLQVCADAVPQYHMYNHKDMDAQEVLKVKIGDCNPGGILEKLTKS
ncbi:hypothetical protein SARC_07601 [Sphaeroforma arctica JP610]|uniref:Uncharacterized protein n=1 Tax=Sphaeroforma arctica JP610 TaxID=667725 RepID=A0A0L0FTA3_9EUKA|nr:hypothetical protein SARC_07601 [Sphaeroforma arctica JP610]KNC80035.1 hypothetical protein SARC_07601 [Sphaeroforma arctica JP610]|eukprot:XP_014153937.1 hypothetical protein SARC_07601 [Sphaeroforma arctica JP610]